MTQGGMTKHFAARDSAVPGFLDADSFSLLSNEKN
jgi:hypothetical protein